MLVPMGKIFGTEKKRLPCTWPAAGGRLKGRTWYCWRMYEGTPESCECEPAVLTQSHPLHRTSQERWDGANLFSRSTQVQEITPDPDEVTGSPYTMATDDICETSKDLPGPSGPQSTRSCSLSSQESVKQWLKSVDRDAESPYPGEDSVAVDETLTDTAVHDGVMEYPFREKISRGDSTEDDLTLGSEAQLLDPPVTTTSAGIPHASAVFAGTRCYWLSNHARMSRQARLMQMGESFESFATDTSTQTSQSSSSIEGLLQSRTCDPEELLLSLGFGGGRDENRSLRVPDRFLQQQSRCGGVDLKQFMVREMAPDTTYQGWADHRKDMTAGSSHDPLRRSVTVSSNNTVTQPSSTGASIADVTGEVEDSAVQMLQQHSGTVLPTSTKAQQHRAKRALLVKQRSAESFSLEKGRKLLTEESEAKRGDSRGKMRKRSLSMPHIQCILEPVKEESPHSSLENTLHSKELFEMLQHAREQEFSQGLAENLGKICSSSADTEDNRWTSSPPPSEGVSGVSPVTQSRDLQDVDMPQLQFTMDKLGGGAIEEKPETSERIAFVISPDAAGVPNVDAESPPEELQLPRDRLTSTPDDKSVSQGLPVPQPHSALPQESFEMEEIGSTDVIPEEGAWLQGSSTLSCSHGNLPHQNSTQSDSSGFADDSHMGSDTPSLMETFKMEGLGSSAESLAKETKRYTKVKDSAGEDVKEIAVRRKKEVTAPPTAGNSRLGEVTAPPTAGNSRLWENLPENEKQESGEKALQNLQLFVKEARAKFRIRREADGECSDGKSGTLLVQPSPAADSPPVARLETGAAEDQGVQRCEKKDHKDEHDDKLCHEDASSMETNQQSDVRRNRAPSVAEELGMDIMEPVNRGSHIV
ncbi:SSFA2 [Branchiostoma lanceolatum]|uniref:SSFA2 protein n=1 Tax=Branchiostoma lanceolatum TaxID=7740 RepID=A0A8J9Z6X9_BRALA|nr:SSFA2 [Branchiostoma lanceolatum]